MRQTRGFRIDWKLVGKVMLAQGALGAVLAIWMVVSGRAYPVVDALFISGMPVFLYGLSLLAGGLGAFDVIAYSFKRLRAVLRRERSDDSEPIPPELNSLLEYKQAKGKPRSPYEYLLAGGLFILGSFVICPW